jgi:hypothetical protein
VYTPKAYRGFESLSLRSLRAIRKKLLFFPHPLPCVQDLKGVSC